MSLKFAALALLSIACLGAVAPIARAQDNQVFDENADVPKGNADVEKQNKGQFPTMQRDAAPVPLGATQGAWDKAPTDAGIYKVNWVQDSTTKIALREAMTTTIRLPEWEKIDRVILGDTTIYHVKQLDDTTVTLWISNPGSDTSLTILGESRNIYSFYLRSSDHKAAFISDLVVLIQTPMPAGYTPTDGTGDSGDNGPVSFLGSDKTKGGVHLASYTGDKKTKPEWLKDVPFDPARIRRDLALYGDAELAPDDVFRDDQFTYLCYGDRWNDGDFMVATPASVIDSTDRPVNFSVKAGCMIIDSTGQLSLKHGNEVLCVKPDPDRVQPRVSPAAMRVKALKPSNAPAAKSQPAAKVTPPSASPLPPAGAVTVTPLPAPQAQPATTNDPNAPTLTDHTSGR